MKQGERTGLGSEKQKKRGGRLTDRKERPVCAAHRTNKTGPFLKMSLQVERRSIFSKSVGN